MPRALGVYAASICLALAAGASLAATDTGPPAKRATIQLAPTPPAAATMELMRRWHHDYRGRISPVLQEWEQLARAARGRPGSRLMAGCRRLDMALARLVLRRLRVRPDPSVSLGLEEMLRSLTAAATSCTHGAYFLAIWRLREADDSWRELRNRLLLYDLAP